MSHHESSLKAQFYLTAPQPCAYLEGREERKVFTTLQSGNAVAVNNALSLRGFRRSQSVIYRPACIGCSACMSIRIPVSAFVPSRTQRRTIARNADVERRTCEAWATESQFRLFRRYLDRRHADGGMADMDAFDYASMVDETPVNSTMVEYTLADSETGAPRLIAACLSDMLADGLSMVYSFFEPEETARSLGSYMIIDHIRLAAEMGLPFVYLGYWVAGSPKMHYKVSYRPFELCDGANWRRFSGMAEFRAWRLQRQLTPREPLVDCRSWRPARLPAAPVILSSRDPPRLDPSAPVRDGFARRDRPRPRRRRHALRHSAANRRSGASFRRPMGSTQLPLHEAVR